MSESSLGSKRWKALGRSLLLNLGVFAIAVVACAVAKGAPWARDHWDVVLGVGFGLSAVLASVLTDWNLEQIRDSENDIRIAEQRLQGQITNLEDATRRTLSGFAEIFARALWLIERAQGEIWYVNFLFSFGYPHLSNKEIHVKYKAAAVDLALEERDLEKAVERFRQKLLDKVRGAEIINTVTLYPKALRDDVLRRLRKPGTPYENLIVKDVCVSERKWCTLISHGWNLREGNEQKITGFNPYHRNKLPCQMLIANIPGEKDGSAGRRGCLVFLVGTENVKGGTEPKGFYTELDAVVDMYRELAGNLVQEGDAVRLDASGLGSCWPKFGTEEVFALFSSLTQAEQAVDALVGAGFRNDDVSVLAADQKTTKEFATEKTTKAPEATTTGATSGGTLELLAGIGALAIPDLGPSFAKGPIMGALEGVCAGAATRGLIGALVEMGMPEYEAKRYEGRVKEGGILVSVHCDDCEWVSKAQGILERAGSQDIASAGEKAISSHTVASEAGREKARGVSGTDYRKM